MHKGELLVNMIKWLDERVAQPPSCWVHSDNVHGDPSSLSDARLKSEVTHVSGTRALDVLSQIQGCTYEREDLQQRRLGLLADEAEEAIDQLAIDNVLGSRWHDGGGVQGAGLLTFGRSLDANRQSSQAAGQRSTV